MYYINPDAVIITDFIYWMGSGRALGAYRVATELRAQGYTCQVIDHWSKIPRDQQTKLLDQIIGDRTRILGISTTFMTYDYAPTDDAVQDGWYSFNRPRAQELIENLVRIKQRYPKLRIVQGGRSTPEIVYPGVDILIRGSGDQAMVELMKWVDGKNPFFQFEKDPQGHIIIDGDILNTGWDFNSSQVLWQPYDNILPREALPIEIARGCIFKCSFCSYALNGKKKLDYIKHMSVLRDELIRNWEQWGTTRYFYSDDTLNDTTYKLQLLADLAQSLPFRLEFTSYLRADLMHAHPEQIPLLEAAGLRSCHFGIETLNHSAGKAIGKGLHPEKLVETLYKFRDQLPNVRTAGSFIVGLPTETKETITTWSERIGEKDFPLDRVIMSPLRINREGIYDFQKSKQSFDKRDKSEFDLNWEKWYEFRPSNDRWNWYNGDFDFAWARQYAVWWRRNRGLQKNDVTAGWEFFCANSLWPDNELGRVTLPEAQEEVTRRAIEYQSRYLERLLDLTPQEPYINSSNIGQSPAAAALSA